MKKNRVILYYLLIWACWAFYLYIDNVINKRGYQPYIWSNLAATCTGFSFCFFIVYPRWLKRKKMHWLIPGLLIADGLFIVSRYLIEEVLYPLILGHGNYDPGVTSGQYISDNWWRGLQPVLFSFIVWALFDTFKKEREAEQLTKERIQAELLFLKTQVNPHFLYNTLNYMYSLAYPVSDRLAEAIIKLSQLMRYMLHNTLDGMIGLQPEIDYLNNYIEIYRLRFEDHFFVQFRIQGDATNKRIASLVLIPFVENAFKHGIVDDAAKPVQIQLDIQGDQLLFRVTNSIHHDDKDHSSGIGLANIRRRLSLIYPGSHELMIVQDKEIYTVHLSITLN
ncbi:MAG: histidine kinase [Sphingobacteriales bacterium]|nr:histidine kinase [Sphingobacteriales bacterium]OJW35021.1 MAG: hypothetical protein BGO54_02380 [Sphingobacteriales bacterium 46-32]